MGSRKEREGGREKRRKQTQRQKEQVRSSFSAPSCLLLQSGPSSSSISVLSSLPFTETLSSYPPSLSLCSLCTSTLPPATSHKSNQTTHHMRLRLPVVFPKGPRGSVIRSSQVGSHDRVSFCSQLFLHKMWTRLNQWKQEKTKTGEMKRREREREEEEEEELPRNRNGVDRLRPESREHTLGMYTSRKRYS